MNPLEQKVAILEQKVSDLESLLTSFQGAASVDQLIARAVAGQINLGDLKNVTDTGITNGQLLKWNSSTNLYEPANDIDT